MIDIAQFGNVASLAVLVLLVVQFFKAQVAAPKIVPLVAIGTGVVLAVVFGDVQGQLTNASQLVSDMVGGFLSGLIAIGGYESSIDKILLGK